MSQSSIARMDENDINLALCADVLSESNASMFPGVEVLSEQFYPGDAELIIGWEESVSKDWPMFRAALELYTWATNMDQGTKSLFVNDPKIDGTVHPGKWRQASVRRIKTERSGSVVYWIVLTLRAGYSTTLKDDEARFTEITGVASTGSLAGVRTWHTIDPSLTTSLTSTLAAVTTVTDPFIEGVKKTGTFASSQVVGRLVEDKQTGMISQTLTQINALSGATSNALSTSLAALQYIKTRNTDILDQFHIGADGEGEAYVFSNLSTSDEKKIMETITDAHLVSKVAILPSGISTSWVHAGRSWKLEENGTATFTVAFVEVHALAGSTSTPISIELAALDYTKTRDNEILDLFNFATGEGDKEAYIFSNLDPDDEKKCAETVTDAHLVTRISILPTGIDATVAWTYAGRQWKVEENGSATFIVAFQQVLWNTWTTVAYDMNAEDPPVSVFDPTSFDTQSISEPGRNWEIRKKTWLNIRNEDDSDAISDLKDQSNTDTSYNVIDVQFNSNNNGSFNITQITQKDFSSLIFSVDYFTRYGTATYKQHQNATAVELEADRAALTSGTSNSLSGSKHANPNSEGDILYDYALRKSPYGGSSGDPFIDFEEYTWSYPAEKYLLFGGKASTTRTIWVKFFHRASGGEAAEHVNASNSPGAGMTFIHGLVWKAVRINDS